MTDTKQDAPEKDAPAPQVSEDDQMKAAGFRKVRGVWKR